MIGKGIFIATDSIDEGSEPKINPPGDIFTEDLNASGSRQVFAKTIAPAIST
jgi:hypothetical protein